MRGVTTEYPHKTYMLTERNIEALRAGAKGNAFALMPGNHMGGAKKRMIDKLVGMGLLTASYPRKTTPAGDAVLAVLDKKEG